MKKLINCITIFVILLLQSCSSEKKALKPYKAVNSDTDTSYKAKKIELISRVCSVNFPIEVKTVVVDSTRTRVIKVVDNSLVNKLKAQLAKGCPTLNIDSIYNAFPLDTIYMERWKNMTIVKKDTIVNFNLKKEIEQLKNNLFELDASYKITKSNEQKLLNENKANINNISYLSTNLLKAIFKQFWWVFVLIGLGFGLKKYFKLW